MQAKVLSVYLFCTESYKNYHNFVDAQPWNWKVGLTSNLKWKNFEITGF